MLPNCGRRVVTKIQRAPRSKNRAVGPRKPRNSRSYFSETLNALMIGDVEGTDSDAIVDCDSKAMVTVPEAMTNVVDGSKPNVDGNIQVPTNTNVTENVVGNVATAAAGLPSFANSFNVSQTSKHEEIETITSAMAPQESIALRMSPSSIIQASDHQYFEDVQCSVEIFNDDAKGDEDAKRDDVDDAESLQSDESNGADDEDKWSNFEGLDENDKEEIKVSFFSAVIIFRSCIN